MELLTLSALSLGYAVVGDSVGTGIAATLGGGVAGNYAYDFCKSALRSVAERAQAGELLPNHVLLRAVRRSQLRATQFSLQQWRLQWQGQPRSSVAHWLQWADVLDAWLGEEVHATRRADYRFGATAISAEQAALIAQRPEGEDMASLRDALAEQLLDELGAELHAWHEQEVAPRRIVPTLPDDFLPMLAQGWTFQPTPKPWLKRAYDFLFLRRGAAARSSRRHQARLSVADVASPQVTWFSVFAAFFADEIGREPEVQSAFNVKLLAHGVTVGGAQIGDALKPWGAVFCSRMDELQARLDDQHANLLAELVRAKDLAERDSLVLRAAAQAIDRIDHRTAQTATDVREIMGRLVRPPYALHPTPWQLPPRAVNSSFTGRADALQDLVARLRAAAPLTCVAGPAGFGKTALAAEALTDVVGRGGQASGNPFPHGVVYLDLYRLRTQPDAVWTELAAALLGAEIAGDAPEAPWDRARRACAGRRLLVVVEGAELADGQDGATRLDELLAVVAPENSCLVLTRDGSQALPAQTIRLDGPLPSDDAAILFDRLAASHPPPPAVRSAVLALLQGHPLALTWAASLLADPAEDSQRLAADWQAAALPGLNDPLKATHTLDWLFQRSLFHLDLDALLALQALGLLAHAPVPLAALVAAFSERADASAAEARALKALKRLVQRSLLLRQGSGADEAWQFTHVLGYGFARARGDASSAAMPPLLGWVEQALVLGLAPRTPDQRLIARLFQHSAALLALADANAGSALFVQLQYGALDRLLTLGQLNPAGASLDAAAVWFTRDAASTLAAASHRARERSVWLNRSGDIRVLQGRLTQAQAAFDEALALIRRLLESSPSNTQWQRDLGVSLGKVGDMCRAQGRLEEALNAFDEALALSRRLAESEPSNTQRRRDLGVALNNVGDIQQTQGRLEEALKAFDEDLALSRLLAESDPSNTEWQRDLVVSLNKVGNIHQAQGRPNEALKTFEECLVLIRRLAESDPSNSEWQRDLGVALNNIGGIQQAQGRLEEALKAFDEDLALSRRLAESDPSNTQWQRDLFCSLGVTVDLLAKLGQQPLACERARECLAIAKQLADLAPEHVVWQDDVRASHALMHRVCDESREA